MKLLIIAAGRGSGFNGEAPKSHKTLSPVCGLAVIERIIAACPLAGGIMAQFYSMTDGVDGELPRLKHQGSWFRAWLDKTDQARQAQPNENYLNFLTTNNMDMKNERGTCIPELAAR